MKKKFMKAGACVLSAAMIMGLYAGPAFADWVENQNGARMWVQDGKAQTGWQQIDGKWYSADDVVEIAGEAVPNKPTDPEKPEGTEKPEKPEGNGEEIPDSSEK